MGIDIFLFNSKIQRLIGNSRRVKKMKVTRRQEVERYYSHPRRIPQGPLSCLLSSSHKPYLHTESTAPQAQEISQSTSQ
jgi:hypothetical protein